ncbi:MAG: AI-2E family transporter [Actinomycetota bacterium]
MGPLPYVEALGSRPGRHRLATEQRLPAGSSGEDDPAQRRLVTRAIFTFLFGALGLIVAVYLVTRLKGLLLILLVSVFVSFALEPAVNFLAQRGWRRGAATGLVFLLAFAASVVALFVVGRLIVDQVTGLIDRSPEIVSNVVGFLNDNFGLNIESGSLQDQLTSSDSPLRRFAQNLAGSALTLTISAVAVIFNFFTVVLFSFYLTADGPKVRRTICSFLPPRRQVEFLEGWEIAIEKTGVYLYSRALLAVIAATLMSVFLAIIGVPYAVALGLWMGITSQFIPTVGTYIGGALPLLVALTEGPVAAGLTLAFVLVYQQIENYVLSPRITARTMQLHPAVAFGTVIAGASILGGIGALLALPAAAIIQAIGSTYFRRHEVVRSELVDESELQEPPEETRRAVRRRFWGRDKEAVSTPRHESGRSEGAPR